MLIRNARVWPPGTRPASDAELAALPPTDVRLSGGRVTQCAPRLRPVPGEPDIDAAGGMLLPGLHGTGRCARRQCLGDQQGTGPWSDLPGAPAGRAGRLFFPGAEQRADASGVGEDMMDGRDAGESSVC